MAFGLGEEVVELIEGLTDGELVGTDKFDNLAAKALFEIVDTVILAGGVGEAVDAIEIVAAEVVLGGVFNHMPLDEILGVVVAHVFFVAAGKEVDNLVAVEHEHGGRERGGAPVYVGFGEDEFGFAARSEEVVHLLVVAERPIGEMATLAGGFGDGL